jgi:hypothetical protein
MRGAVSPDQGEYLETGDGVQGREQVNGNIKKIT